jgi:hypothetical protein
MAPFDNPVSLNNYFFQLLASTNLVSVSVDLLILDILYNWNHTIFGLCVQGKTCMQMFIAALFAIAKPWEQPQECLSTDEWIDKMYIHIRNYIWQRKRISINTYM